MLPRDTSAEAWHVQLNVYRTMGSERRVELALAMSEELRAVTMDGIRRRNPAFDEEQVRVELLRILHRSRRPTRLSPPPERQ